MTARLARSDPQARKNTEQRQTPKKYDCEQSEHHRGDWGDEIAASEEGESVCSKTSERQVASTDWSASHLESERYMQGRPKGVYFTLADMVLRNKAERLTNTALPALGVRWEKQVWHGMECSVAEWNNGLLLLCGAGSG